MSEVTGFRTTSGKGTERINFGDFLTITETGEYTNAFRAGFSVKDNADKSDFEERVFKYVNERLKELGYV